MKYRLFATLFFILLSPLSFAGSKDNDGDKNPKKRQMERPERKSAPKKEKQSFAISSANNTPAGSKQFILHLARAVALSDHEQIISRLSEVRNPTILHNKVDFALAGKNYSNIGLFGIAALMGHEDTIFLLINQAYARPSILSVDEAGENVLHYLIRYRPEIFSRVFNKLANSHSLFLKQLITPAQSALSLLYVAAAENQEPIVRFLFEFANQRREYLALLLPPTPQGFISFLTQQGTHSPKDFRIAFEMASLYPDFEDRIFDAILGHLTVFCQAVVDGKQNVVQSLLELLKEFPQFSKSVFGRYGVHAVSMAHSKAHIDVFHTLMRSPYHEHFTEELELNNTLETLKIWRTVLSYWPELGLGDNLFRTSLASAVYMCLLDATTEMLAHDAFFDAELLDMMFENSHTGASQSYRDFLNRLLEIQSRVSNPKLEIIIKVLRKHVIGNLRTLTASGLVSKIRNLGTFGESAHRFQNEAQAQRALEGLKQLGEQQAAGKALLLTQGENKVPLGVLQFSPNMLETLAILYYQTFGKFPNE